jgi:YD repeat-containing protein
LACTLNFTSPADGATVRSPNITVYGQGGASANEGDAGTVTATLNGASFFNYSGSFTAAVTFLQSRGVGVTLRPGLNFLYVNGSVGGCTATDTMTVMYEPELIQSKNKGAPPPESCQFNPINIAVGNKYQNETDFQSATSPHLGFTRSYNSFDGFWRHNFSTRLVIAGSSMRLIHADGRELSFTVSGSTATPTVDEFGTMTQAGGVWTYTAPSQEVYRFDGQGRLTSYRSDDARLLTLTYAGATTTVTSDSGEALSFTQDAKYQPLTLTTPSLSVTYIYDIERRLDSLEKSYSGVTETRQYLYEDPTFPRFLTGIIDENGDRYVTWGYDTSGRTNYGSYAGGETVTIDYRSDGSARVTNALGKSAIYRYQVIQGVKKLIAIEGEPSANCPYSNSSYTYDSKGLLKTKTDNKGNLTTYDYNTRGQEISRTEASGTPQARTITTTWHSTLFLPTEIIEPDRTTTFDYDPQGRQLSRTVVAH